jgi:hypothetical protein
MEVAALKSSPFLATIDPSSESLPQWPERSILDANGHFKTSQPSCLWVSPAGGAPLWSNALIWTLCLRQSYILSIASGWQSKLLLHQPLTTPVYDT